MKGLKLQGELARNLTLTLLLKGNGRISFTNLKTKTSNKKMQLNKKCLLRDPSPDSPNPTLLSGEMGAESLEGKISLTKQMQGLWV